MRATKKTETPGSNEWPCRTSRLIFDGGGSRTHLYNGTFRNRPHSSEKGFRTHLKIGNEVLPKRNANRKKRQRKGNLFFTIPHQRFRLDSGEIFQIHATSVKHLQGFKLNIYCLFGKSKIFVVFLHSSPLQHVFTDFSCISI